MGCVVSLIYCTYNLTLPKLPNHDDFVKDLKSWMTDLPEQLKSTPLIHLAIPGSHDSITYNITKRSEVSPDSPEKLQKLTALGPVVGRVMSRWAKAQAVNVREQLEGGIRYFDLRIALKKEDNHFYFVHGLYSDRVRPVLEEINDFLNKHSKEVIILDFQHLHGLGVDDHDRLVILVTQVFTVNKIAPRQLEMVDLTLNAMVKNHWQIIIIYRQWDYEHPLLWTDEDFPTYWANTNRIKHLMNYLNEVPKRKNHLNGAIFQCVLTPPSEPRPSYLCCNLKQRYLIPLERTKENWINNQKPGPDGVNVIISDFVNFRDYTFPKQVIALNKKLLDKQK